MADAHIEWHPWLLAVPQVVNCSVLSVRQLHSCMWKDSSHGKTVWKGMCLLSCVTVCVVFLKCHVSRDGTVVCYGVVIFMKSTVHNCSTVFFFIIQIIYIQSYANFSSRLYHCLHTLLGYGQSRFILRLRTFVSAFFNLLTYLNFFHEHFHSVFSFIRPMIIWHG